MLIEFYPINGGVFKLEIPLPLPPRYRIAKHSDPCVAYLGSEHPLDSYQTSYHEFELAIIKPNCPFAKNVVGIPRKAYREKRG